MKLTQTTIRQIIKEEIQKVLNEDLYATEEEYEQAIKDFMELHNVSREEAKQAIDAAGEEMDKSHPMHGRYIQKDKSNIEDYKFFIEFASRNRGNAILKKGIPEQEILDASEDFKINYEQYLKMSKHTKRINTGYEYCLNKRSTMDAREPSGEKSYEDILSALEKEEGELKKSFLTRDLGAGFRSTKIKKQLDDLHDKKTKQCNYYLGLAALRIKQEYAQYLEKNKRSIIINTLKEEGFIVLEDGRYFYFKIKNPETKRYFSTREYFRVDYDIGAEENIEKILNKLAETYPYSIEQAKKRKARLMGQKGGNRLKQLAANLGYTKKQMEQWGEKEWQGLIDHRDPTYYR